MSDHRFLLHFTPAGVQSELTEGISAQDVAKKKNIPTSIIFTTGSGPLPIVITGTMPRDEETLKLVSYLNQLQESGQAVVYYYPGSDHSDPVLTNVKGNKARLVNPVRVPEDLRAKDFGYIKDRESFYAQVRDILRQDGTQCLALAFPSLTSSTIVETSFRYIGRWTDITNDFDEGTQCPARIYYEDEVNLMSISGAIELIGPANIARMEILEGPTYEDLKVDRERMRKTINDELEKQRGDGFEDKYTDGVIDHLLKTQGSTIKATSSSAPLHEAGIEYTMFSSTSSLANEVSERIAALVGQDPALAVARETANSILEKAKAQAAKILEGAHEDATEAIAAAAETSAVIGELPEMLNGFLGDMAVRAKTVQEQQLEEAQRQSNRKRICVKEHCDRIADSLEKFSDTKMSTWAYMWGTLSASSDHALAFEHLNRILTKSHPSVPSVKDLQDLVNESNTGIKTMTLEDAVVAVGVHHFIQAIEETESGQRLSEWNVDGEWTDLSLDDWMVDQDQIDSALFDALTHKAKSKEGITTSDRKFLEVCDDVLGNNISKSLKRSINTDAMEDALDEISIFDPLATNEDIGSLISQIETIASGERSSANGSSLAQTIRMVTQAAQDQSRLAASNGQSPILPSDRVMQSDGSVAEINSSR